MLCIDIWSTVYNESFCKNNLFARVPSLGPVKFLFLWVIELQVIEFEIVSEYYHLILFRCSALRENCYCLCNNGINRILAEEFTRGM